ncbi:MAG: WbqC family protein [Paludibacteraceae bacterium]|nr:WbqC family protein [Paludibacteraceae bacterium]MBO7368539.1 WbqC family protein [Paludibacteraceae bacterium]
MTVTLPCTYIGSTALYKLMAGASTVYVEVYDHYSRQTFRTRTVIMGANGQEALTIPVVKPEEKTLVKDILINNDKKWQIEHLRALQTAYNTSPFLEFYIDDLMPFYTKKFKYLADYNMQMTQTICSLLGISPELRFTDHYEKVLENDYRHLVEKHAQVPECLNLEPYYQVFGRKFGFQPNLTILDLIFNMGPESILFVKKRLNVSPDGISL